MNSKPVVVPPRRTCPAKAPGRFPRAFRPPLILKPPSCLTNAPPPKARSPYENTSQAGASEPSQSISFNACTTVNESVDLTTLRPTKVGREIFVGSSQCPQHATGRVSERGRFGRSTSRLTSPPWCKIQLTGICFRCDERIAGASALHSWICKVCGQEVCNYCSTSRPALTRLKRVLKQGPNRTRVCAGYCEEDGVGAERRMRLDEEGKAGFCSVGSNSS